MYEVDESSAIPRWNSIHRRSYWWQEQCNIACSQPYRQIRTKKQMNKREEILNAIRSTKIPTVDLPSLDRDWITYDDPAEVFAKSLAAVGGKAVFVDDSDGIRTALEQDANFSIAKSVFSQVPDVVPSSVDLNDVDDPHDLEALDYGVFEGQLGVAENAAIWLTDDALKHRVAFFIPQHVIVVLKADAIVNNLHEAYEKVEVGQRQFGLFMSGPSKTADIEQSLVIGAHGARSLTVFVVKNGHVFQG